MSVYSNRARKNLVERIKGLGLTEHDELLRILKAHGVPFTQNSNGVFINISAVDDVIIDEMQRFVSFCVTNMQELDDYDKRLNDCKSRILTDDDHDRASTLTTTDVKPVHDAHAEDDFNGLIQDVCVNKDAVLAFTHNAVSTAAGAKKKACTKFAVAKKRFAKKHVASDAGVAVNVLQPERYEDGDGWIRPS